MELLIPAFIAGLLTILAPCSITLLPVMLSGSVGERNVWKPLIVGASLSVSILLFTLILKAGVDFIDLDEGLLRVVSGLLIFFLGIIMTFPDMWAKIQVKLGLYKSEELVQKTGGRSGFIGSVLLGASLGPVFTTCSPTYLYIIGSVLPVSFLTGTFYMLAYVFGLFLMLIAVGYGGRAIVGKLKFAVNPYGWFRKLLGVLLVLVGLVVMTGFYRTLESYILDFGGGADYFLINIEDSLMDRMR